MNGPARDKVAARAERFVNFQIETLLKPLLDLKNAEQLTGIARGIAFQLVENFGLLNRRDIAEDIKSLDQDGRAALRRLGVRFGAYHIFVPTLLKPAPAGIVTLLWALKTRRQGPARLRRRRAFCWPPAAPRWSSTRPSTRPSTGSPATASSGAAPCASTSSSGLPT